jgi:hypothetical protein
MKINLTLLEQIKKEKPSNIKTPIMTLCLAWKRNNEISFASDSRLSNENGETVSDIATKIFKIRVRINSKESKKELIDLNYGLRFCGSYLNGSILADTISEILSSMEISKKDPITINSIVSIAFSIYKDVSTHLMSIHKSGGLSKVLFGGFCPESNSFRIFTFSWKLENHKIDFPLYNLHWKNNFCCADDAFHTFLLASYFSS